MVLNVWQVVAFVAIALFLIALAAWIAWARAERRAKVSVPHKLGDKVAALRSEMDGVRDRGRLLEERFERFERTHVEMRDAFDRMREDVEARLVRASSNDMAQRELQEQINEIRKQHHVMMDRDERQERRLLELQEYVNDVRSEMTSRRTDDGRVRT